MKTKNIISDGVQLFLGVITASIGLKGFLLPNHFLDGGVTGVALLLNRLFAIDVSLLIVVINVPFLLIGYYRISKKMFYRSLLTVIVLAIVVYTEEFPVITEDKLLIAIFGGIFLGAGIGLSIRGGAVLDGVELLAIFLSKKLRVSIGNIILLFNIVLFALTALLVNVEIALYSILTFLVASKSTDFIIQGVEEYIGVTVVSEHNSAIKAVLIDKLGVGVTVFKGAGGYGQTGQTVEQDILHTIVTRLDIRRLHLLVESIDVQAFVVEYDVNEVKGGVVNKLFRL